MSPVCSLSSRRSILYPISSLHHMMIPTGPGTLCLISEQRLHGKWCVMMTAWLFIFSTVLSPKFHHLTLQASFPSAPTLLQHWVTGNGPLPPSPSDNHLLYPRPFWRQGRFYWEDLRHRGSDFCALQTKPYRWLFTCLQRQLVPKITAL